MSEVSQEVVETPVPSESELVNQTEQDTAEATAAESEVEQQEQVKERTFSQAELDAAIQKRLLKEQRKWNRQLSSKVDELQSQGNKAEPQRESFQDDEAYYQAMVEHAANRRAEEIVQERSIKSIQEQQNQRFLEKAEDAIDRYDDFFTVVTNPSLPITPSMVEFFSESEVGADLAYYLGKHPLKASEIAGMSPLKAARELVKLEAELASKPKAQMSKAPEPINPVGKRGNPSTSKLPSDEDDIDTWMQKERDRQRARPR